MSDTRLPAQEPPVPYFRSGGIGYYLVSPGVEGQRNAEWNQFTTLWDWGVYEDCDAIEDSLTSCAEPISGSVSDGGVYYDTITFQSTPLVVQFNTSIQGICVVSPAPASVVGTAISAPSGFILAPTTGSIGGVCGSWSITLGDKTVSGGHMSNNDFIALCRSARIHVVQNTQSLSVYDLRALGHTDPIILHVTLLACGTGSVSVTPVCSFDPPVFSVRWDANYDCMTQVWSLVSSSTTQNPHPWFEKTNGYYMINRNRYLTPDLPPVDDPSCFFYWTAWYDCMTQSWTIYLDYVDSTGAVSDWSDEWGYYTRITDTPNTPPPPPSTPECFYYWSAFYLCPDGPWQGPNLDYVDSFGMETDWEIWGDFASRTTTSPTPPDLPIVPGECY